MQFLWTYVFGIVLAALPNRWRRAFANNEINWEHAALLSGFVESIGAIVALGYWYIFEMGRIVSAGVDAASSGRMGPGVTDQQISALALTVLATHPLTWLLAFLVVEGAVRLCAAAFTESAFGILPLALVDWCVVLLRDRQGTKAVLNEHARSFVNSVRERMMMAARNELPDELQFGTDEGGEILEICSSRRKTDWTAPKVVRVDDAYYRLESCSVVKGLRPFRYRVRRLEAGVPGRNVAIYETNAAVLRVPATTRK